MRARELLRRDELLIIDTSAEAEQIRERRRLLDELMRLAHEIHAGRMEFVAEYRRIRALHFESHQTLVRSTPLVHCTKQGCHGTLNTDGDSAVFMCQTCHTRTCVRCGELYQDDHACDENVVASREAITRDCKACVRCHAPSFRIEGCPTMWCPHCHTFWNWDTERIIETRGPQPHNPDHRAFLMQGTSMREIDDIPCGGIPEGIFVNRAFVRQSLGMSFRLSLVSVLIDALQCLDVAQRLRHRYPQRWTPHEEFRPVRLSFILGDVTHTYYESTLERMERTFEFRKEIGTVLEWFVFSGADVFQRFCADTDAILDTHASLLALRKLADERLEQVGLLFKRKAPRLLSDWTWVGLRRR